MPQRSNSQRLIARDTGPLSKYSMKDAPCRCTTVGQENSPAKSWTTALRQTLAFSDTLMCTTDGRRRSIRAPSRASVPAR
ncbi:hypothetical protein [Azospirillum sp. Marseille-Q6669]